MGCNTRLCAQGDLRPGGDALGAQEVLDALAAACTRGAGRPLTAWAAATFRACGALRMAPADAAALGPRPCLRLLLMRGPQAAPVRFRGCGLGSGRLNGHTALPPCAATVRRHSPCSAA